MTGLTNDTEYTFKLRAVNSGGAGTETAERTATPVAAQAAEINLWSATLTVGQRSGQDEYGYNLQYKYGSLSPTSFTHGERRYTSPNFSYRTNGHFTYAYFPDIRFKSVLTLIVDGEEFSASDPNYNSFSGSMFWINHGLTWGVGDTVRVSLKATLPGAPASFSATAGPVRAALAWTDPSDATITKYQYRQKEGSGDFGNWKNILGSGATTTSHTVTGLTAGTSYIFQVRAVNAAGPGAETQPLSVTPEAAAPAAPTDFSATEGDASVILRWTAAADNGSPLTKYQYQQDGGAWTDIDNSAPGGANALSFTVTGLTNDTEYTFKLRAVNNIGEGAETDSKTATPLAPAGAPSGLTATASSSWVRLEWTNPGNSSITGYQVRQSDSVDSAGDRVWGMWESFVSGAPTDFTTVRELSHGIEYAFQIRAMRGNVGGVASESVTATLLPAKPVVTAQVGVEQVTLSWPNPNDASITGYQVKQGTGAWTAIESDATTTSHTVTGLSNGTEYTFQIRAMRGAGEGDPSDAVTATPLANPAPAFATETATLAVAENTASGGDVGAPVTATDADGDELIYSLSGTDAASFAISGSTGKITVASGVALDFENPGSDDGDNEYTVTVSVSDGEDAEGNTDATAIVDDAIDVTISVTNVDEQPALSGSAAESYAENGTDTVASYTATDPEGGTIDWTLSGDDSGDFSIGADGALSFNASPNFEDAQDADTNNVYLVTVEASDGTTGKVTLAVTVTVTGEDEAPTISGPSSAIYAENSTAMVG